MLCGIKITHENEAGTSISISKAVVLWDGRHACVLCVSGDLENQVELEEKTRLISQVLELQNTLEGKTASLLPRKDQIKHKTSV